MSADKVTAQPNLNKSLLLGR